MTRKVAFAFFLMIATLFLVNCEDPVAEAEEAEAGEETDFDSATLECILSCSSPTKADKTSTDSICAADGDVFQTMSKTKLSCLQFCGAEYKEVKVEQCNNTVTAKPTSGKDMTKWTGGP